MTEPKHHVLIIDDEPLNRDLMRRVLQSNYQLSEAGDAAEAVALLEAEGGAAVHLILCDHLMPGKTGAAFAAIVRDRWPEIAFMLITGYDGDEEVQRALDEGQVQKVLSKPWRAKELRAIIAAALEG